MKVTSQIFPACEVLNPDLQIDSGPEDNHPGQSVVEATAGSLAIEHTGVDTLPEQRRIGDRYVL